MKKITAVFYEYPAALHEIKAWEELKKDDITDKFNLVDNTTMYFLNTKNEHQHIFDGEVLICTTLQNPYLSPIEHLIKDNYYYKTLIFGKVTSEWLTTVNSFLNKYEKIKQGYQIQI